MCSIKDVRGLSNEVEQDVFNQRCTRSFQRSRLFAMTDTTTLCLSFLTTMDVLAKQRKRERERERERERIRLKRLYSNEHMHQTQTKKQEHIINQGNSRLLDEFFRTLYTRQYYLYNYFTLHMPHIYS